MFTFNLQSTLGHARAGQFTTAHGQVLTPIFMPVGTVGTVKALDNADLLTAQAQIILANTYHLYLKPGLEIMQKMGGLHRLMGWQKPILTDSGGFQVFSLKSTGRKITDQGVEFVSHLDGSHHFFTPEKVIQIQQAIGADIIMAFDECTPDTAEVDIVESALSRTHAWAPLCIDAWEKTQRQSQAGHYQALFGIIQGGLSPAHRVESAQFISSLPFDGIAVGGESIGYNMAKTVEIMDWIRPYLPARKPHYSMGLGLNPTDLIQAVWAGFDMFDCVAPTRLARNGGLYVGNLEAVESELAKGKPPIWRSELPKGRLNIGNSAFATDTSVIQPGCDCYTCTQGYSRAYLHHLYKAQELSYYRLASIHNVRQMVKLSQDLRDLILEYGTQT